LNQNPLGHLSIPARLVIVSSILVAVGGTIAVHLWLADAPYSQTTLLYYLAGPIAAIVLLTLGTIGLWLAGIATTNESFRPGGLTMPGIVLLFMSILLAIVGTIAALVWVWPQLPSGRYPVLLFVLPTVVVAALFYALGAAVFRLFGIGILGTYSPKLEKPQSATAAHEPSSES
jgi:hypothetical protein